MLTVSTIKLLQRLLNPNDLQKLANKLGLQLDLQYLIAYRLRYNANINVGSDSIAAFIKNNYQWFLNTPAEEVKLVLDQKFIQGKTCVNYFGKMFCFGTQQTVIPIIAAGAVLYFLLKG